MATKITTCDELQRMTHEQRRAHFAASLITDPEYDDDPRVRALFQQARHRAEQRLIAPRDGD